MKQNIFGVILFSIIVGTAVYVSQSTVTLPKLPAVEERPVYESRTSCRKVVVKAPATNLAKIKVTQAVLNPRTNQLITSLWLEKQNPSINHLGVTYHFFVKDGSSTRYLASETVAIQPSFNSDNIATHEIMSSYNWLDNFDVKDNLYLIASTDNDGFSKSKSIPGFDELNAVPVLLMKGKK